MIKNWHEHILYLMCFVINQYASEHEEAYNLVYACAPFVFFHERESQFPMSVEAFSAR